MYSKLKQEPSEYAGGYLTLGGVLAAALVCVFTSCSTPNVTKSAVIAPDADDGMGGSFLESYDIRTVASRMCPDILSVPEISTAAEPTYVAIAPIRNSTRYIIDKDMIMMRLRAELNRYSSGRVRFLSQGVGQEVRTTILNDQDEEGWSSLLEECADVVVNSPLVTNATTPVRIAVIPVKGANLTGVNADSFTALLRSKISEKARGKVEFLAREDSGKIIRQIMAEEDLRSAGLIVRTARDSIAGVDYFLGGQFIAQSLQPESATVTTQLSAGPDAADPGKLEAAVTQTSAKPNVNKYLNVMLIDSRSGSVPLEKSVLVERKVKSGLSRARYILTGELRSLSKASDAGNRSDYVTMSFQLVDPKNNEIVWENLYETKKVTERSVLYK